MTWLSRIFRRKYRSTGTLFGNPSVLDDVRAHPLSYAPGNLHSGDPFSVGEEAIGADIARDMASMGDELTESEEKLNDYFAKLWAKRAVGRKAPGRSPKEENGESGPPQLV